MWCTVTGAAGFIGGHLVRTLLARGYNVCAVDINRSRGLENLRQVYGDALEVVQSDLVEDKAARDAVESARVVFHLAAETDLGKSVACPTLSMADDLMTTVGVLQASVRSSFPPRVVLASSAAVYGGLSSGPLEEGDAGRTFPLSPYGIHKKACEEYADMYHEVHRLSTVSLRLFNVYGPGQSNHQAVIPAFILRALRGQPLQINGDGEQTRDFVHVSDVVEAMVLMAHDPQGDTGQFNVASGQSISLLQLVKALETVLGKKLLVEHRPGNKWDIRGSSADIGLMRTKGWSPKTDFLEGLNDTVEFYQRIA